MRGLSLNRHQSSIHPAYCRLPCFARSVYDDIGMFQLIALGCDQLTCPCLLVAAIASAAMNEQSHTFGKGMGSLDAMEAKLAVRGANDAMPPPPPPPPPPPDSTGRAARRGSVPECSQRAARGPAVCNGGAEHGTREHGTLALESTTTAKQVRLGPGEQQH